MKILAIDTSSQVCSVSIVENERVLIELKNTDEKTHSQKLMPLVDEAFARTGLSLDHMDLLACCVGPGSFTGSRIGIATVKAFADTKKIPTIGVTSLEGMAYNILAENVCVLLDAKHENVYLGLYQLQPDDSYGCVLEKAVTIEEAVTELKQRKMEPVTFLGDGVTAYLDKIVQNFENCRMVADELNEASSVSIAKSAYTRYKKGQTAGTSKDLIPVYLKKSQAERALEGEK